MNESLRKIENSQECIGPFQIPKKWRTILLIVTGIGTFFGSFLVTYQNMNDDEPKQSIYVTEKIEELHSRVNDIAEMLSTVLGKQVAIEKQIREVKRDVKNLDKGDSYSPEEQLNEILEKLIDFEKRGIKRK